MSSFALPITIVLGTGLLWFGIMRPTIAEARRNSKQRRR